MLNLSGNGAVVQLVRMPACHAGGRGFEPHLRRFTCRNGGIGRRTGLKIQRRRLRVGSTPTFGIKRLWDFLKVSFFLVLQL